MQFVLNAELPRESGWYWYAEDDAGAADCVVFVATPIIAGQRVLSAEIGGLRKSVREWGGFWAGPIPRPGAVKSCRGLVDAYFEGMDPVVASSVVYGLKALADRLDERLAAIEEKLARAHLREDVT